MSNIVPLRPPGHLPTLPAHIQRRFDLAATADEDLEPVYLADAGENAIAVRRAITGPAPTKAIDGFVSLLVRFLGPGPLAPDVLIEALAFSCDDLPPQCWTGDVARQIVRQEKFLPGVAEIRAYLLPVARPLWRGLSDLERCARTKPPEAPRPAPSPEEIAAVAAAAAQAVAALSASANARDDQRQRSAGRAIAADKLEDDDASFVISATSRDAQLAAFGDIGGDVDLLAKVRAKYEPPREPKP